MALVTAVGILCIAGCMTVGPDYEQPEVAVPDAWHTAATADLANDGEALHQWWTVLGDDQLNAYMQEVIDANHDLRTALWRVEEARALRGVVSSAGRPQVEASGRAARALASDNASAATPEGGFDPANSFELGVGASWEIDLFGRIRRSVEAADADIQATEESYRDVLVSIMAEAALAYVDLRTTQERQRLAESNLEVQRETLQLTQDRFDAGLVSGLDIAQAEANLATTRALIPSLQNLEERSLNRLAVLTGRHPGTLHERFGEPIPVPEEPASLAVSIPADVLRQRPDIRRAERQLAAQTARIGVATADLYPSFSLTGFVGLASMDAGDFLDSDSVTWSAGLPIRWSIFSAGRIRSQIAAEEAATEQFIASYEQAVLVALEEVENAVSSYQTARDRRQLLEEAVDATDQSLDLVLTQYRAGLTNFQNVLDTQRSLLNRQDEYATVQGDVFASIVGLYRAMGGGWDPADPITAIDRTSAEG
jgi:multidrug efflux system outer membrane protein